MLDTTSQRILTEVLWRESRSLLSYLGDAYPWASANAAPALQATREVAVAVRRAIGDLGRFVTKQKITPPPLGSFPANFTALNFVALSHLLPKLVASEAELIDRLEHDLPRLGKEAAGPVQALLDAKKAGLEALKKLAA